MPNICAVQLWSSTDHTPDDNRRHALEMLEEAARSGDHDLIVLPEAVSMLCYRMQGRISRITTSRNPKSASRSRLLWRGAKPSRISESSGSEAKRTMSRNSSVAALARTGLRRRDPHRTAGFRVRTTSDVVTL